MNYSICLFISCKYDANVASMQLFNENVKNNEIMNGACACCRTAYRSIINTQFLHYFLYPRGLDNCNVSTPTTAIGYH